MAWSFVLTDLQGNVQGEVLNARERKLVLPLNRIPTVSFTIPLWHDLAGNISNGDCLLKVYRRDTQQNRLLFNGPITSVEEKGESGSQSIGVVASGPFWRLTKRFIGLTKSGIEFPAQDPGFYADPQTVTTPNVQDLGQIAHSVLNTANSQSEADYLSVNYGYTGIDVGSWQASVNGFTGKMWLKNVAELIGELAAGLGSFDYEVAPTEPDNSGGRVWPKIGNLNIYTQLGSNQPDAIFEYGTSRANVSEYSRTKDWANLMNAGYISLPGWPDQLPSDPVMDLIFSRSESSMTSRGFYMDIVNDAGVTADDLRTKLVQEQIKWRKAPRQITTFVPAQDASPLPFVNYNVGDYIRGRAVVRGSLRFDLTFRVWGMTFNVDDVGSEKLELQLIEDAS